MQRLSPIPISSPDSTRELLGPEHLGNLILQFRLAAVCSPPQNARGGGGGDGRQELGTGVP